MSKKFCPKCGEKVEKVYNNLCSECFLKKVDVKIPSKIILRKCKICGKYYIGEGDFDSAESTISKILSSSFRDEKIKSVTYRIVGNRIMATLVIGIEDVEKEKTAEMEFVEKLIICKYCAMKNSKYFNATIQVRVGKEIENEIINRIQDQIYRLNRSDKFAFVSAIEKLKEGYNVYIGSKSAAEKVAISLKKQYKLNTKISRKQYGIEEGRTIYRDTILLSSD